MIGPPSGTRIWIAAGVSDMHRGMYGLAALVEAVLAEKVYGGDVFVFRGRRGDLIKVLWADRDGMCQRSPPFFQIISHLSTTQKERDLSICRTPLSCAIRTASAGRLCGTLRVECAMQDRPWSPHLAQVTGMLCRWDSSTSTVTAVRVEVILDFLTRYAA